ncbi:hypothetical protein HY095_04665 [Candidatus Micrarchaeota archaeon]|nr:hypothetical protein [Candidatus Micrarchaeota archaeon]
MTFAKLVGHALKAYSENLRLLSFFSIPFLIAFPLALLLPNYVALGGIYLRLGSIGADVSAIELLSLLAVLLVSLLLFSFAVVAVNSVLRAQRSLNALKHTDFERMEEATIKLFTVLLAVFIASFAFNLALFESGAASEGVRIVLNSLFSFALALLVLFVPQAIVIDNASVEHAVALSYSMATKKFRYAIAFVALAAVLLALNAVVFSALAAVLPFAPLIAIAFNALVFLPFLEVVKVQIYLSKYSLLI